jgi:hypothetical protein
MIVIAARSQAVSQAIAVYAREGVRRGAYAGDIRHGAGAETADMSNAESAQMCSAQATQMCAAQATQMRATQATQMRAAQAA